MSLCIAKYTVPESREQPSPPTSIQLLSTNKTSDDNLSSIFGQSARRPSTEIYEGDRMTPTIIGASLSEPHSSDVNDDFV